MDRKRLKQEFENLIDQLSIAVLAILMAGLIGWAVWISYLAVRWLLNVASF